MPPAILILAAEHPAPASAQVEVLTPLAPGWITSFLLLILWLFVLAVVLGPLIRHFKLEPRSSQFFTGERPQGGPRRA